MGSFAREKTHGDQFPVYPTAPVAPRRVSPLDRLQGWLPKLVLAPSVVVVLFCMYGYIGWTLLLSFTNSRFMPSYKWAGLSQYQRLWDNDRWWVASKNLLLFGGSFIAICLVLGVFSQCCWTSASAVKASSAPSTCIPWRCR